MPSSSARTSGRIPKCLAILCGALATSALPVGSIVAAKDPPTTWQGLTLTASKTLDALYTKPGVSLSPYERFMLDPVEVEFR